ncbi:hypothetical protein B0H14DRAFT_2870049 [Mycena olivaceomarginata]|nr:hypothetical protein B0H14DRAFT_2870049 [Mycena olivaceomarginata]
MLLPPHHAPSESRPQHTSTLHVRYALLMDHPKDAKTSDVQLQLRLCLNEVLPRRANPQPRNPKKKEPHSPILGVLSSPPDGCSHPPRLSVISRLRRRIGPLLRAKKIKIRQCRGADSHRQAHAWGHPWTHAPFSSPPSQSLAAATFSTASTQ